MQTSYGVDREDNVAEPIHIASDVYSTLFGMNIGTVQCQVSGALIQG